MPRYAFSPAFSAVQALLRLPEPVAARLRGAPQIVAGQRPDPHVQLMLPSVVGASPSLAQEYTAPLRAGSATWG